MTRPSSSGRRPYKKPTIVSHGSLVELTRALGPQGRNDMVMGKTRTGF